MDSIPKIEQQAFHQATEADKPALKADLDKLRTQIDAAEATAPGIAAQACSILGILSIHGNNH